MRILIIGYRTLPLPLHLTHHITIGLLTAVPFTRICPAIKKKKKFQGIPEGKEAQTEETQQASESDMAGLLELIRVGI